MNLGKRLVKGDTVAITAPAGFTAEEKIRTAVKCLEALGYRVKLGESCKNRWYGFSGSDDDRAAEINDFFEDPEVRAILCLRGGYGSIRLLDRIDYGLIRNRPKIFVGYSDVTALHVAFNRHARLVTFHGPMPAPNFGADFDAETQRSLVKSVCSGFKPFTIDNPQGEKLKYLVKGTAEGPVIGGNLMTLVSLLGTPYAPDLEGKILFIEEVGEATYRIDRALTQLLQAGMLRKVKGVVLGDFKDCRPSSPEEMPLTEVFRDRLGGLGVPIVFNLKSGHCRPMVTLPLGALAGIGGDEPRIEILEKVVE